MDGWNNVRDVRYATHKIVLRKTFPVTIDGYNNIPCYFIQMLLYGNTIAYVM